MILNHAQFGRRFVRLAATLSIVALLAVVACSPNPDPDAAGPSSADVSDSNAASDTSDAGDNGDVVEITLPIANRATTTTRDDLKVQQGDMVKLSFSSDEIGEVHLHGYDLTAQVSPDQPGELVFEAENAGAFGINFHVFGNEGMEDAGHSHSHDSAATEQMVSDTPVAVSIAAEVDADGGVDVQIAAEGMSFAPELVDQEHTPGAGHAHIYVDGEKLGRVFEPTYHIADLPPGDHEIMVSLNTNDHRPLVFDGAAVEDTVTVTVPDIGQGSSSHDHGGDGHEGHDHGTEHEIVAEVHLGNLEVYP